MGFGCDVRAGARAVPAADDAGTSASPRFGAAGDELEALLPMPARLRTLRVIVCHTEYIVLRYSILHSYSMLQCVSVMDYRF